MSDHEVNIEVRGRHGGIDDSFKSLAVEKARKLLRFHGRISSIQIVVDQEHDEYLLEIIVHVDSGTILVAKEAHATDRVALDSLLDKIQKQLKRDNEKLKSHKGDRVKQADLLPEETEETEETYDEAVRKDLRR